MTKGEEKMAVPVPSWWCKLDKDGKLSSKATPKERREYASYMSDLKSGGKAKKKSQEKE